MDSPDGETLIDRYEVRYAGLETPAILHLDWYHYTELLAPQGFTCGQAFNLGIPPPDPFMAAEQLERLAIADAGDAQAAVAPIELGGSGPASGGVAFDHYRLIARAARAARLAGTPLVSGSVPTEITKPHSVVVAFPQTCESRTVSAADLKLEDPRGRQAAADALQTRADAIARLLPGVDVPAGSVAAVFGIDGPRGGFTVKATYPDACSGATEERSLAIETTGARLLESPMPTRPAGDAAIGKWIAVQAIVDHAGRFREATALGGAPDLSRAAVDAVSAWRADPPRVNGAPLASPGGAADHLPRRSVAPSHSSQPTSGSRNFLSPDRRPVDIACIAGINAISRRRSLHASDPALPRRVRVRRPARRRSSR